MNYKQSILGGIVTLLIATSCCWIPWLAIILGGASGLMGVSNGMKKVTPIFMIASFGFLAIGVVKYRKSKKSEPIKTLTLKSTITCPKCNFQKEELMLTDACQFFYDCPSCKALLKAKPGDCCVFCSYGTVPCPPIQADKACC